MNLLFLIIGSLMTIVMYVILTQQRRRRTALKDDSLLVIFAAGGIGALTQGIFETVITGHPSSWQNLIVGIILAIVAGVMFIFQSRHPKEHDSLSNLIWLSGLFLTLGALGVLFDGPPYSFVDLIVGIIFAIAAGVVFLSQSRQPKEHDYLSILIGLSWVCFLFGALGVLFYGHPFSLANLIVGFIFAIAAGVVFISQSRQPKEHERAEENT